MDFMSDTLENGRRVRVLNVMDDYNREALWIDARFSYTGKKVVEALEILMLEHGEPRYIRVDNGPEFICKAVKEYIADRSTQMMFIEPGKPMQNAFIERFNRHYREDILDAYIFSSIEQLQVLSNDWKDKYNSNHPHSSLGGISPIQFKLLRGKENFSSEIVKAKMNDSTESALTISNENIGWASKSINQILLT